MAAAEGRGRELGKRDRLIGIALCGVAFVVPVPVDADVVTSTAFTSYRVSGTTPLTILHSMLKQGQRIGHNGSMAITNARLRYKADLEEGDQCRVKSNRVTADFTISLPMHPSEARLSARTRKAFRAFRDFARRHEIRHRDIYLECAHRADRAIRKIGPAASCRAIVRRAKQVWKAEIARCKKAHAVFDAKESARSDNVPLLREAIASYTTQMRAQLDFSRAFSRRIGGSPEPKEGIGR